MSEGMDVGNRPSMRDVVDIVTDTRKELNESITSLGGKFDAFVTSNEHRLTVVEMHQASQGAEITEVVQRLNRHGEDIGALKDQQKRDEATTDALAGSRTERGRRWTSRNALILTLSSLAVALSSILAVVLVH